MIYEKLVIRIRHYVERTKKGLTMEDYYLYKYTDDEIGITWNIWEAIDCSDMDEDKLNNILKELVNHFTPKKDYRIQTKIVKAKITG
jgi:hypothetical protein